MFTLLVVLVVVGSVIGLVLLGPNEYRVERSVLVYAFATDVFSRLNDLRRWADWSPWEGLDPGMSKSFSGPASGIGASYAWWSRNRRVGAGRMTIIESRPDEVVNITLEFLRPFKSVSNTELSLRPDSGATRVTWTMTGTNSFLAKLASLFMNMDRMIGRDFMKGLSTLKSLCEAEAARPTRSERPAQVGLDERLPGSRPAAEASDDTIDPSEQAK